MKRPTHPTRRDAQMFPFVAIAIAATFANASPYAPRSQYALSEMHGWKIYVHRQLIEQDAEVHRQTMKLLDVKLHDIQRVVPAQPLRELRKVPLWVEADNDHEFPCICYHFSKRWMAQNGFNPIKVNSIEICNASRFLRWTHAQPWIVMHEMAHAYHHRFLGRNDARIKRAHRRALESKRYDSVLRYTGNNVRYYGLKNAREFFAEMTESYFGVNDFFPFNRGELRQYDARTYQLLRSIWGEPPRVTNQDDLDFYETSS